MIKICICGGGSLGHVCAAVLASQADTEVRIFTLHPEHWNRELMATDPDGKEYRGRLSVVSANAAEAVSGCDIVFLCLPGFAIEPTLERIRPYAGQAVVGSIVCSTGFFFAAHRILGTKARLFGFQRTPFIARTTEYGRSANLLGYKQQVAIAVENMADADAFRSLVERLWLTPTVLLGSHYEASLTNSNPILHTGRLYAMWHNWDGTPYDHNILFYKEWTDAASEMLIAMDAEFMRLLDVLPVRPGAIPTLLDYYESHDAPSLTRKISSIPAFAAITSPMKELPSSTPDAPQWVPDFESRYFTEDFPYGLSLIVRLAKEHGVPTPALTKVLEWGMAKIQQDATTQ